ncbi:hypothetical protein [Pseudoalteromonas luteoviolacea]|uniref:Uncharacterized protein n=1 Tax=Pseudoalteromonas luteoviolacea S4054 TaxID=1129367 RepID=A0A0F6ABA1_9GAMM|nr:hypothetical protein [Pseudoalteromonas luteoviolacea]AOT06980.1 hypothetical protein S4054249_03400 [Pseudoalteromonas luteoviolacea]AOT11898.1 hypothetical protein S40542_03400 [Pseudoalteromonas luteoviolacea]AOT16810.1 hypothetical protein S4054_03400 [Pseudoalteromonas luteoviolacea]KKE82684.1 hypothetical protein N479_16655 [Pseudoalteromonas luteoviolacea S4054]KZN72895.1 hypothetical protein N481_13660 [Pseudoalteromonas luteoviolacea S4047-1]
MKLSCEIEGPFSHLIRKCIPADEYWELCKIQRQLSFCEEELSEKSNDEIKRRIKNLEEYEQLGFVYIGEKKWLKDYLSNHSQFSYSTYSDWVLAVFNNYVLFKPFKWGMYEDENGRTSDEYRNIWCGKIIEGSVISLFNELTTAKAMEKGLGRFFDYDIEVFGCTKAPDKKAIAYAYEFLHDFPYYLEQAQDILNDKQYDIYIDGISLIDPGNHTNCDLMYSTDYTDGINIEFSERKRKKFRNLHGQKEDEIKGIIKNTLDPYNHPKLADLLNSCITDNIFGKLLFGYLPLFSNEDFKTLVQNIWREKDCIYKGAEQSALMLEVKSFATLEKEITQCDQCDERFATDIAFEWGNIVNYPTYKVGDHIYWGDINRGEEYFDELFVMGRSLSHCKNCSNYAPKTLIHIKANKIIELAGDKIRSLPYGTIGEPFITSDMIPVEDYENRFFKDMVSQAYLSKKNTEAVPTHSVWRTIQTMVRKPPFSDPKCNLSDMDRILQARFSRYSEWVNLRRLFFLERHCWDKKTYQRMANYLNLHYYTKNQYDEIDHQTPIKSCCILKDVNIDNKKMDYVFYWGNLLNFPEYQLGEKIQWSEYSVGEQELTDVHLIGHPLQPTSNETQVISIRLVDGTLVSVEPHKWSNIYQIERDSRIAYLGPDWDPYLTWDDVYLMK